MSPRGREVPMHDLPLDVARRRALERAVEASGGGDPSVRTEDGEVVSRRGAGIAVRTYRPAPGPGVGTVVFFHGGGWVYGDLDSHDGMCRDLAADSGLEFVAVDFRRAPEDPFPAALEDAEDVVAWVMDGPRASAGGRVAVAGDSSGANLAAAVCLSRRDAGQRLPVFQLLVYPLVDLTLSRPSMVESVGQRFGGRDEIERAVGWYVGAGADRRDPRCSPLLAPDHRGLPPAHVVTAGFDPLRDEGIAFVGALDAAGVPVSHRHYDDQIHGFLSFAGILPDARQALADAGAVLAAGVGSPGSAGRP